MKSHSKSIFNIFTFLTLLALLFGVTPALPVQAESLASLLFANEDLLSAKRVGGPGYDVSESIAVDSNGNVYTTGYFDSTVDFDPGAGVTDLTPVGLEDIFISKFDSNGNFVWAKSMGGADYDGGNSVIVDSNGNVYTTGYFVGTVDFDPGLGVTNLTNAGQEDIFILKLDSGGNFVWGKNMGGTGNDSGRSIVLDTSGNIYICGSFLSATADFDPNAGVFNLTNVGSYDIFISKLDSGGDFVWAKNMGGASADYGFSIALDSSNNVYTTGYFLGMADFDPGAGTANLISSGLGDIFVSKLNSLGSFVWAKRMGGVNIDNGVGIAVDANHNVYTTGAFRDTADFDPGAGTANLTPVGDYDIFISKLDSGGNFVWVKSMGGAGGDGSSSIALDTDGNIYTIGGFVGTADFDPGAGTANLISAGSQDIFVSRLNSNGDLTWAKNMGGTDFDSGAKIALDSSSKIYITGYFSSIADFDPGAGIFNLTSAGAYDIFISKLENDVLTPTVSSSIRANPNPTAATSVDFTVTFSELVTGVDAADFTLTTSGVAGAAISGISGSGSLYTVTVNTGTGSGTIRLDVVNDNSILDVVFIPLAAGFTSGETYNVRTTTFTDVPTTYWAWQYIERLYGAGITGGCATTPSLMYCPDSTVTRAQMAVFLLKSIHGSSYTPPAVGASTGFNDAATDYWAAAWIKQLAAEGITGGCSNGNYCPEATVTRDQMAVFLLKAKYGNAYVPPAIGTGTAFSDVPSDYWAAVWIKQLAAEAITGGCGGGLYCPDSPVTRGQMATFLVKTFSLP